MKRIAGIFVVLAALASSAAVAGDDLAGKWETRLGLTFASSSTWDFNGGTTADVDSEMGFMFGFGYHLNDNLEFGFNFEFDSPNYDANVVAKPPLQNFGISGELENLRLLVDGTYNFMPGKFSPFVSGIIGWTWVDTNIATSPPQTGCWWDPWWGYICTTYQNTKDIDGFTYGLAVGARYDVNESFAIHAQYRMLWMSLDNASGSPDTDGFVLSVGWKF